MSQDADAKNVEGANHIHVPSIIAATTSARHAACSKIIGFVLCSQADPCKHSFKEAKSQEARSSHRGHIEGADAKRASARGAL